MINKIKIQILLTIFFIALLCLSCGKDSSSARKGTPEKIISCAPNITEMLYELGLGEKIAGVTEFCAYPSEAAQKEKIGGRMHFNHEAILRIKPDLAVILKEHRDLPEFFNKYKIPYITVGSDSLGEIIESIQKIAEAGMVKKRGDAITKNLRQQMRTKPASANTSDNRPKVLIAVGRENLGSGSINRCFAVGASSFYNELIEIAGGINVLKDTQQAYPIISAEAIIRLDPDVIIDISSAFYPNPRLAICDDWKMFKTVAAVKNERVHCLFGDYLMIPGPRFGLILDEFRKYF